MTSLFASILLLMALAPNPTALVHAQAAGRTVVLTWEASTTPDVAYNVYRNGGRGRPTALIHTTHVNELGWTDTAPILGVTNCYFLTAVDAGGQESDHSATACAVVPAE